MRHLQRASVDLRKLRRVELCAQQLVEECRDLELSAIDDNSAASALTVGARRLVSAVDECALRWRPIALLGRDNVKAQLKTLATARKARR